jgi:hypothetical protein
MIKKKTNPTSQRPLRRACSKRPTSLFSSPRRYSLLPRKQGMFALLQGNRAALDIPHVALKKVRIAWSVLLLHAKCCRQVSAGPALPASSCFWCEKISLKERLRGESYWSRDRGEGEEGRERAEPQRHTGIA